MRDPETGNIEYVSFEDYADIKLELNNKIKKLEQENEELKDIIENFKKMCMDLVEETKTLNLGGV